MLTQVFRTQSTTLSATALAALVARQYGIDSPIECRFWADSVNQTYMITAGAIPYILRVYRHRWRTQREILAEIELLLHLRDQGVSVSVPIARKDGQHLSRLVALEGARYAVLFSHATGRATGIQGKECRVYGELAAHIHIVADSFNPQHARFALDLAHLVDKPLRTIAPFLASRKGDLEYLRETGRELKELISAMLPTTKPHYGICHGDHHGGNVHLAPSGQMTLFDFDCFGYGWRAYDVAVFLWSGALNSGSTAKDRAKSRRRWQGFLEGYNQKRPLSSSELVATKLFVPIRHIWLLGLHTQGAPNWGHGWLNDGYFDHHIGFIKRWIKVHKLL